MAPEAPEALVSELTARVAASRPRRRAVLASSLVIALGVFMTSVGVGVAAPNGSTAPTARTAAADQYDAGKPVVRPKPKPKPVQPDNNSSQVASVQTTQPSAPQTQPASGTLPFTGLSLLGTVGLGAALVVTGVFLRRRESRS
jgi:hypothetical protein